MTASKGHKRTFKQKDRLRFLGLLDKGSIIPSQFTEEALCLEIQRQLELPINPNVKAVKELCKHAGIEGPMPEPKDDGKRSGGYETAKKIAEDTALSLRLLQEDYHKEMKNLGRVTEKIELMTIAINEQRDLIEELQKEAALNKEMRKRLIKLEQYVYNRDHPWEGNEKQSEMPLEEDERTGH